MRVRLHAQHGFTMPLVLGALMIGTLLAIAAFAAARGGIAPSGKTRDDKQAYAAAEAGVNWYLSRLIFDNAFWEKCTSVRGPAAPVNDPWNGAGADPRLWRAVPDATAAYSIELLPANGAGACNPASGVTAAQTMLDTFSGTFRIRSTGRVPDSRNPGKFLKRSIVATFRRARFNDFLYLTQYETTDPLNYPSETGRRDAERDCGNKLRAQRPSSCSEIQFAGGDLINGPLHSNDSLLVCGNATFGRSSADVVETSASSPGWLKPDNDCGSPTFNSALRTGAGSLDIPSEDDELQANVQSAYRLSGTNYLTLNGDTITIKKMTSATASTTSTVPWPSNGLIYVDTGPSGCGSSAPPAAVSYTGSSAESFGCANVYVRGTYSKDLTIASAKDVIVGIGADGTSGSLTQSGSGSAVAGLIASRFVRVYHPVTSVANATGGCFGSNAAGSVTNMTIEAAILAREHSFTVDNYRCGSSLGTLTVKGAIAQSYRGAVATTGDTGYVKNYNYDDRLTYRNPPFFLDPANATWRVLRTNEQVPAR